MRFPLFTIVAAVGCISACDAISANDAGSVTVTSQAGLKIYMTSDPGAVEPGSSFTLTFKVSNAGSAPITVGAPGSPGTDQSGPTYFAQEFTVNFTKDGVNANDKFTAQGFPCMWRSTDKFANGLVQRTLAPTENLTIEGLCGSGYLALTRANNSPTPSGTYKIVLDHHLRTLAPISETIAPVTMDLKVR